MHCEISSIIQIKNEIFLNFLLLALWAKGNCPNVGKIYQQFYVS